MCVEMGEARSLSRGRERELSVPSAISLCRNGPWIPTEPASAPDPSDPRTSFSGPSFWGEGACAPLPRFILPCTQVDLSRALGQTRPASRPQTLHPRAHHGPSQSCGCGRRNTDPGRARPVGRSTKQGRGKGARGQGCHFWRESLSLWGGGLTPGTGPDVDGCAVPGDSGRKNEHRQVGGLWVSVRVGRFSEQNGAVEGRGAVLPLWQLKESGGRCLSVWSLREDTPSPDDLGPVSLGRASQGGQVGPLPRPGKEDATHWAGRRRRV